MVIDKLAAQDLILNKKAQLLDVRTKQEWDLFHLPNAINLELDNLIYEAEKHLDKSLPVIVYCEAGIRSANALEILKYLEFIEVYDLQTHKKFD